jgi:peptide chain release factor subunit 1
MEKRHNYVRKVAELATQIFITNDRPNVAGLVLSGSADFKTELSTSDMFDPRLQAVVLGVVDVSYGEDGPGWQGAGAMRGRYGGVGCRWRAGGRAG